MKILIFEWAGGTYTHQDITETLRYKGIEYKVVSYCFDDLNQDEFFEYRFLKFLSDEKYDFVYSTNFFPLVAKCCHRSNIKYISWSYDNPLDVTNIGDTLGLPGNYVFLFDKIQVAKYKNLGFESVYHLPLAVNTKRLDTVRLTKSDISKYGSDISFVGKLYESQLPMLEALMPEDAKEVIEELVLEQSKIYGNYFVDQIIAEEFIDYLNDYVKSIKEDTDFLFSKEMLSYAIGTQITRNERLILLKLLANHYEVKVYSRENNPLLSKTKYMGTCSYLNEMPKIFKASKINLNINLRVSQSGIPLRVMDVLGCGGFLISSYQPEIDEYLKNGEDVVLYTSIEDAYEKASYYLKNDEAREKIRIKGYNRVKEKFSYDKQIAEMVKIAKV